MCEGMQLGFFGYRQQKPTLANLKMKSNLIEFLKIWTIRSWEKWEKANHKLSRARINAQNL